MYQILSANQVYDIVNELKIELNIFKETKKYDIAQFLDDVSLWMDENRDVISETYLPFSVLSVGTVPVQVSAFMYGMFVGKALSKNNVKLMCSSTKVDKKTILKDIEEHIDLYNGLMGNELKEKLKEKDDDSDEQDSGEECHK
jgi:hypothetical protein